MLVVAPNTTTTNTTTLLVVVGTRYYHHQQQYQSVDLRFHITPYLLSSPLSYHSLLQLPSNNYSTVGDPSFLVPY